MNKRAMNGLYYMIKAEVQTSWEQITFHQICVKLYLHSWHEGTHAGFHFNDYVYVSQGFQGFGFGDGGFQMSFGIGAFPFGIFATAFNINDGRPPPGISLLRI